MKLDLDRTDIGFSEISISGQLELDWDENRPGQVSLNGDLRVNNLEQRVLLIGKLAAQGQCTCARCLEPFDLVWDVPVEIMVLRDIDTDEGQGDTLILHQNTGEVDLGEALHESLVLAYPAATICRPECKGICPQCGLDLNKETCECQDDDVDPRWAGLDALEE